jgi:thiol-disulfide isomerase/thioredoxin
MAANNQKLLEILSAMKDPSKQAPVEHHDLYTEQDPVIMLDDGSFLRSVKIRDEKWNGPGVLKVYAPWCPHCQSKVEDIKQLAEKYTIYVLDATVNPMFRFAHGITAYPSFFKVLDNGQIGDMIDGDLPEVISYLE